MTIIEQKKSNGVLYFMFSIFFSAVFLGLAVGLNIRTETNNKGDFETRFIYGSLYFIGIICIVIARFNFRSVAK